MASIQELKSAGFSNDEINAYMSQERLTLQEAGFGDDEINTHFGEQPFDLKESVMGVPPEPLKEIKGPKIDHERAVSAYFAEPAPAPMGEPISAITGKPITSGFGKSVVRPAIETAKGMLYGEGLPEGLGYLQKPTEAAVDYLGQFFMSPEEEQAMTAKRPTLMAARYAAASLLLPGVSEKFASPTEMERFTKQSPEEQRVEITGLAATYTVFGSAMRGASALMASAAKKYPWLARPIGDLLKKTKWYTKATIKVKGRTVQSLDEMVKAGFSEANILKTLRKSGNLKEFKAFKTEAIKKRMKGEVWAEPIEPAKPVLPKEVSLVAKPKEPIPPGLKPTPEQILKAKLRKVEKPIITKPVAEIRPDEVVPAPIRSLGMREKPIKPIPAKPVAEVAREPVGVEKKPVEFIGMQERVDETPIPLVNELDTKSTVTYDPAKHEMTNLAEYEKAVAGEKVEKAEVSEVKIKALIKKQLKQLAYNPQRESSGVSLENEFKKRGYKIEDKVAISNNIVRLSYTDTKDAKKYAYVRVQQQADAIVEDSIISIKKIPTKYLNEFFKKAEQEQLVGNKLTREERETNKDDVLYWASKTREKIKENTEFNRGLVKEYEGDYKKASKDSRWKPDIDIYAESKRLLADYQKISSAKPQPPKPPKAKPPEAVTEEIEGEAIPKPAPKKEKVITADQIAIERAEIEKEMETITTQEYDKIRELATLRIVEKLEKAETKEDKVVLAWAKKRATEFVSENKIFRMVASVKKQGGLNRRSLETTGVSDKEVAELAKKFPGLIAKEGRIYADKMADEYGYDLVDEMYQEMMGVPSKKEMIKQVAKEEMYEYDTTIDISRDLTLMDRFLEEEIKVLNEMLGKKPKARKDLKEIIREKAGIVRADEIITVKEREALRDQIRLEARAARKAFSAGKKEAALKHKERQRELLLKAKAQYEVRVKKIKTSKEILQRRRSFIRAAADKFNLTDAELRQISRKDIRLMSNLEFKQFKDMIQIKAEELDVKRQAINELELLRKEKEFIAEDNIRKLHKLPTIKKMTVQQLNEYADILSKYEKGDQFLTPKRIMGIENTPWKGSKTMREVLEKASKELDVPLSELKGVKVHELDRFRYDTSLSRQSPLYNYMIDTIKIAEIKNAFRYFAEREKLYRLGKVALKSRKRGIIGRLVPRQKDLMKYMEAEGELKIEAAKNLTIEKIALADGIWDFYRRAYNWLLVTQELKTSRFADSKYVFHSKRPLSELLLDLKDTGIKSAAKDLLNRWRLDEAQFKILDSKTGEILRMKKFFRQTLYRTGELTPTKNVIKATDIYMQQFFRKMAIDESVPAIETLVMALRPKETTKTGVFLNDSLMTFVKEYLNAKKGRTINIGIQQGGRIDTVIRFVNQIISLRYIALNIPLEVAAIIGETTAKLPALGNKKLILANVRKFTPRGRRILKKYKAYTGEGVIEEIFQPARNIGENVNMLLYGLFKWSRKVTKQDILLGNMTKAEFKAETISNKKLAEMTKLAGRWIDISGAESIVGKTSTGAAITKFKGWAIPIASSAINDAMSLARTLTRLGDPKKRLTKQQFQELYRIAEMGVIATAVLSLAVDEDKDTFLGRLKYYAIRELGTIYNALSPRTMLTFGVTIAFLEKLSQNLYLLITLEKYKTRDELKGVAALKKQLKPAAISQFESKKKKISRQQRMIKPISEPRKQPLTLRQARQK